MYLEIKGKKKTNLVLLHGWATNLNIWHSIIPYLTPYFKVYLLDIPGFGKSKTKKILSLKELAKKINCCIPKKSILLGWSIGGIIATKIALLFPKKIIGVITIASSPCLLKKKNWPGTTYSILNKIKQTLIKNYKKTIKSFLLQNMIKKNNTITNLLVKNKPSMKGIFSFMKIALSVDLRKDLLNLSIPILHLYGEKDKIVPKEISCILKKNYSIKKYKVIKNSFHAPFISHPKIFCNHIIKFKKNVIKKNKKNNFQSYKSA